MFTQIEETTPLLSKKEYIALEIAKAKILIDRDNVRSLTSVIQDSVKAAQILISECKS